MARKAGMTQIFTADGLAVPATLVSYKGGNVVTAVRTVETDGYAAVQVGFGECKEKALNKPELGHLKKSGAAPMRTLVEFRLKGDAPPEGFEPGAAIDCSAAFAVGEMVDVAGTSIGKGFQGTIKRWNHKRGLMSHGSKSKRQHGSIGSSATPSRVLPGLRMAGRMGGERVKIRGLEVLAIEAELGFDETRITHGEAVALGCAMAFRFSAATGLCEGSVADRVEQVTAAAGLPARLADVGAFSAEALVKRMAGDKKAEGGRLTLILARSIGDAFVDKAVDPGVLADFLVTEGAT